MQFKWKKLIVRTLIWLAVEIYLSLLGLDTLADYGEFILVRDTDIILLIV